MFGVEEQKPICSAWFTKKPPRVLAHARRRWFVLLKDEIRYYKDACLDLRAQRQLGAIGLFHVTKCCIIDKNVLIIVNPDRQWRLVADSEGAEATIEVWQKKINAQIQESKNPGYTADVSAVGFERKYSKRKDSHHAHRTYYGFGEDESMQEPANGEQDTFGFDVDELQECWFAHEIGTDVCDNIVLESGPGAYVVRCSLQDPLKPYTLVANDSHTLSKFSIHKLSDGSLSLPGVGTAADLKELVVMLQRTPLRSKKSEASLFLNTPVGNSSGPNDVIKGLSPADIAKAVQGKSTKPGKIHAVKMDMLVQLRSQQSNAQESFYANAQKHEWEFGVVLQIDTDSTCLLRLESGVEAWFPDTALCEVIDDNATTTNNNNDNNNTDNDNDNNNNNTNDNNNNDNTNNNHNTTYSDPYEIKQEAPPVAPMRRSQMITTTTTTSDDSEEEFGFT